MRTPKMIIKLNKNLEALIEADDKPYLPVQDVAKYRGIDKEVLRHWIYTGSCPFGIGKSKEGYGNGFVKIPKLTFWAWVTKGVAIEGE